MGHANIWTDAEDGLFWDGVGDAGVYLPGDSDNILGSGKIGKCNHFISLIALGTIKKNPIFARIKPAHDETIFHVFHICYAFFTGPAGSE